MAKLLFWVLIFSLLPFARAIERPREFMAREAVFKQTLSKLSAAQSLDLYADVLDQLETHHWENDKATTKKLFAAGLDELIHSLGTTEFRQAYCKASEEQVTKFQERLRTHWRSRVPNKPREARRILFELLREAQTTLGCADTTPLIMEFVAGSTNSLDAWTGFVPAQPMIQNEATVTDVGLVPMKEGVGYIRIAAFRESTPRELQEAIDQLQMKGMRSLVIDLRGNVGGGFTSALRVAEKFLSEGNIVSSRGRSQAMPNRTYVVPMGHKGLTVPMAVLVDGKTMSAAEVVVAAWKDHDRAIVIGTQTYGKGLAQAVPAPLPAGELIISVAELFSPNGRPLNGNGIAPHVQESESARQLALAGQKMSDAIRQ
ncbi:MAG: S41 family peptidase [Fimbriiglobus sp.]